MSDSNLTHDLDTMPNTSLTLFALVLFVVTAGVLSAVVILPAVLPGLTLSLTGQDIKAYWYISRASAIVAYALLWLSMAFGLLITNKLARLWPGGLAAYDTHQFISLLGLSFVLVHALILIGDRYMAPSLVQVFVPFSVASYRPGFVGLGQVGFYLWLVVIISFYLRRRIGTKTWRLLHYATFLSYIVALVHGIGSGTDTSTLGMQVFYWGSAGILVFMVVLRVLSKVFAPAPVREPGEG